MSNRGLEQNGVLDGLDVLRGHKVQIDARVLTGSHLQTDDVIVLIALDGLVVNALDLREHELLRVSSAADPQLPREHFERQTHFGAAAVVQRLHSILRQRILCIALVLSCVVCSTYITALVALVCTFRQALVDDFLVRLHPVSPRIQFPVRDATYELFAERVGVRRLLFELLLLFRRWTSTQAHHFLQRRADHHDPRIGLDTELIEGLVLALQYSFKHQLLQTCQSILRYSQICCKF